MEVDIYRSGTRILQIPHEARVSASDLTSVYIPKITTDVGNFSSSGCRSSWRSFEVISWSILTGPVLRSMLYPIASDLTQSTFDRLWNWMLNVYAFFLVVYMSWLTWERREYRKGWKPPQCLNFLRDHYKIFRQLLYSIQNKSLTRTKTIA
jgi:hypothetical protein